MAKCQTHGSPESKRSLLSEVQHDLGALKIKGRL